MTEGQKTAILDRLCAADAATQLRIADAIRQFPDTPLSDIHPMVETNTRSWAEVYVESLKHADMAHYLSCLAFFYSAVQPTNSMAKLIEAKTHVVKRGKNTELLWKMLSAIDV